MERQDTGDQRASSRAIELFFEVNRLNRHYSTLRYGGGSPQFGQYHCLLALRTTEAISQKKLAETLGIRPTSAAELLGKLEQKGLVERYPSERDRRVMLARLTAAGRARAEEIERDRVSAHRELVAPLTDEEQELLADLLEKVRDGYRKQLAQLEEDR